MTESGIPPGAAEAGRHVALDVAAVATRASLLTMEGHGATLCEALRLAVRPLASLGAHLEVLRSNSSCIVVRSRPNAGSDAASSCAATRGLLETLPELIGEEESVLVENRCAGRGAEACLYSVLWHDHDMKRSSPATTPPRSRAGAGERQVPLGPQRASEETLQAVALDELLAELTLAPAPVPRETHPAGQAPAAADPAILEPAAGEDGPSGVAYARDSAALRSRHLLERVPWARRRAWLAAVTVCAGLIGGIGAGLARPASSSAETLLVVRSGTTAQSPGGAAEAAQLAVTYAALLPKDTAFEEALAARLDTTLSSVRRALSVTAVAGTALFSASYSAPTRAGALAGATAAAKLISSARSPGSAIVPRSVAVVSLPLSATPQSPGRKGALAGTLIGLLIALVLVLTLERVDARVDDAADLADSCGCPTATVPDGMSIRELASALARVTPDQVLTLVPLSSPASTPAARLARLLASWWPPGGERLSRVPVVAPYREEPWQLSDGEGPTVLVVTPGEKCRLVTEACDRLRLLGRAPAFGVLAVAERGAPRRGR